MTFHVESNRECVSVNIVSDVVVENTENFSIVLMSSNPQVNTTEPSKAIVFITDDDGMYCTGSLVIP